MVLSRRMFLATSAAAVGVRAVPALTTPQARRVLTLVYDKALGGMRAVDRIVGL